ncbi:ATP-binding cassette domain-containing protein [Rhodopseudomonas palustris]
MTSSAFYARLAEVGTARHRLRAFWDGLPVLPEPADREPAAVACLQFRGLVPEPAGGGWSGGAFTFDLRPGDVIFVVGPNGAGKTTLLKSLAGLYPVASGQAIMVPRSGPPTIADDAMRRQLFSGLFAEANVPLPMRCSAALQAAIDMVGLSNKLRFDGAWSDLTELSYGERRRVDLALVLAEQRAFVILDESTANQSGEFKSCFFNAIVPALRRAGRALVIATHDEALLPPDAQVVRLRGRDALGVAGQHRWVGAVEEQGEAIAK